MNEVREHSDITRIDENQVPRNKVTLQELTESMRWTLVGLLESENYKDVKLYKAIDSETAEPCLVVRFPLRVTL